MLNCFRFRVDAMTGELFVGVDADKDHSLLDRETISSHYLTFEAIDGGGLRTAVQLDIELLDVNDNAPQIYRPQYDGYIRENSLQLQIPLTIEVRALPGDSTRFRGELQGRRSFGFQSSVDVTKSCLNEDLVRQLEANLTVAYPA